MIPANRNFRVGLLALIFITSACGVTQPASSPNVNEVETVVAETLQAATEQALPSQTGISVSGENVSFIIPDGLSTGATYEIIPQRTEDGGGPWGVAPEHIEFNLTDYPKPEQSFDPVIHVYPAQDYANVNPWAESSLTRLQAVLASPSQALTNEVLPTVPFNGAAAQLYAAQAKLLSFNDGNGVRMISLYGQFPGHVTTSGSFYHYEGLTSDGKYFVAALLPLILPLKSTSENPTADGVPYPADISDRNGINAYYQGITDLLNAANPGAFQPNLEQLDALVQSITVTSQ